MTTAATAEPVAAAIIATAPQPAVPVAVAYMIIPAVTRAVQPAATHAAQRMANAARADAPTNRGRSNIATMPAGRPPSVRRCTSGTVATRIHHAVPASACSAKSRATPGVRGMPKMRTGVVSESGMGPA